MNRLQREKRILVTGGAGFLGSHLCAELLSFGHDVVCVDDFSTGFKENVENLLDHPRFELIEHDISRVLYVDVDEIYNLACPASPMQYQKDPIQTIKTSVIGSLNMLELARKNNAKILQASTSEIYGDPLEHPQQEHYWGNVNPTGPRACYDEGKRCAETLFFDYLRKFNVRIKMARIFNTYGPNMHPEDGRVVSNFMMQIVKNEPLTVYGDGSQTRSFCYVKDMVNGLITLMESEDSVTGPINLGNPFEFTIIDLANLVLKITKSNASIVFKDLPADDPQQRKPEISLAKKILRWQPIINLEDGLIETFHYFSEKHSKISTDIYSLSGGISR